MNKINTVFAADILIIHLAMGYAQAHEAVADQEEGTGQVKNPDR